MSSSWRGRHWRLLVGVWASVLLLAPSAFAQRREQTEDEAQDTDEQAAPEGSAVGGVDRRTGYELELHGSTRAPADQPLRLRGVAYEVRGLATLRALSRGVVQAFAESENASEQPLARVTADDHGRFLIEIPAGVTEFRLQIGTDARARSYSFEREDQPTLHTDLLTDRSLYEPGEPIHVWARVTHEQSGALQAGRLLRFRIHPDGVPGLIYGSGESRTNAAGVASVELSSQRIPASGSLMINAFFDDEETPIASRVIAIGTRTMERLMIETSSTPSIVAPGETVQVRVLVRTPSGALVRDARVDALTSHEEQADAIAATGTTNREGTVTLSVAAPAYSSEPIQSQRLRIRVRHGAYGSAITAVSYTLARAPWSIEAMPANGAVPVGMRGTVYLTLSDPSGAPAPAGTRITVSGSLVEGSRQTIATDRHGVASFATNLPSGAAAQHTRGLCEERVATSFDVEVQGNAALQARMCVRVSTAALVTIRSVRAIEAPGARVAFTLESSGIARERPIVVDAYVSEGEELGALLASAVFPAGSRRGELALPARAIGLVHLRARPVIARSFAEGAGSQDIVLVRSPRAFSVSLSPERALYRPREEATIRVQTPAGTTGTHLAMVVRDLAAHAGEGSFDVSGLLNSVIAEAAEPSQQENEQLLRVALASVISEDSRAAEAPPLQNDEDAVYDESLAENRGDLRDPFARREELLRRGVAPMLTALEAAISDGMTGEADRAVLRRGGGFMPAALQALRNAGALEEDAAQTLGGEFATLAMLQNAVPEFTFDRAARRAARRRLVGLMSLVSRYVQPEGGGRSPVAGETPDRWLSRMVQRGALSSEQLRDPWGGTFQLRRAPAGRTITVVLSQFAPGWELISPGPDHQLGTGDDVRDPFERIVPEGSVYALAVGEDALLRALASLAPANDVLEGIARAYLAQNAETEEERLGSAVGAGVSEGTVSRAPVNSPAAAEPEVEERSTRGRRVYVAREAIEVRGDDDTDGIASDARRYYEDGNNYAARDGREEMNARVAQQGGARMTRLAQVVRERFPATLRFVASSPADASGATVLRFPLADAITTYRVEVLAWTEDGWTTHGETTVRVDQDAVVDAPVPPQMLTGERVQLPVRVANHSSASMRARIGVQALDGLRVQVQGGGELEVPAGEAREVAVEIDAREPSRGVLELRALDASGAALDVVRRPLEVVVPARLVRTAVQTIIDSNGSFSLTVPSDAVGHGEGSMQVMSATSVLANDATWPQQDVSWRGWYRAMQSDAVPQAELRRRLLHSLQQAAVREETSGDPAQLARLLGALWRVTDSDAALARGWAVLRRTLETLETDERTEAQNRSTRLSVPSSTTEPPTPSLAERNNALFAEVLIALAPTIGSALHAELVEEVRAVTQHLRVRIENDTLTVGGARAFARAAAALALTGRGTLSPRGRLFLQRAGRTLAMPGTPEIARTPEGGAPDAGVANAAWYAIALQETGARAEAVRVFRSILLHALRSSGWSAGARASAALLLAKLAPQAAPDAVQLRVDQQAQTVAVREGTARVDNERLPTSGTHRIEVQTTGNHLWVVTAEARYGRPWDADIAASQRGVAFLSVEGEAGARDERTSMVLVVRNRAPRSMAGPLVEVRLPTGAEVDQFAREELRRRLAAPVVVHDGMLVLRLRALPPGATQRIALPLRWTLSGTLYGPGIAAYSSENLGASVSVSSPALVRVVEEGNGR